MNTHEAIKILRNTAWLGTNEDREKTEQAIEVVAEALEQEPSRATGKWIPVSERLPKEKEKEYLIYTNTGYICACRWTDDIYGLGVNGEFGWHIIDKPQYTKVIAWMPLPEPYREREE